MSQHGKSVNNMESPQTGNCGDAILELWIVLSFFWSLKSRTEAYRQSSLLEKAL
jgi:hypothetical protein